MKRLRSSIVMPKSLYGLSLKSQILHWMKCSNGFEFHREQRRNLHLQETEWERWDTFLILYVDDILLIRSCVSLLN